MWTVLAIWACRAPDPPGVDLLEPGARAARISVALRGVRPTPFELALARAEPGVLDDLVDGWLADPRFGVTVRDLHDEVYWVRADTQDVWPALGPLEGLPDSVVYEAMQEAPLRLIEHVVQEGRPYSEIVTAPYTWTDAAGAVIEGLPYDPRGAEWQASVHVDGRPEAGILSSTGLWQRWWTNQSGKHRTRANLITKALLCQEIGALDLGVFPNFDPTDDAATADALATDPACTGCHDQLDPLSAYFWGFELQLFSNSVREYPVRYWDDHRMGEWARYDLPPPAYYGVPGRDLADLGQAIAADPRFAPCAVKQAWWYLAQDPAHGELPDGVMDLGTEAFGRNLDWRAMVRALVTSDAFLGPARGPLQLRPEAMQRNLEATTGFRWQATDPRFGRVDAFGSSLFGARDLAGGADRFNIVQPSFDPSASTLLTWDTAAQLAAGAAVQEALILDPTVQDEAPARRQLVALVARLTSRDVAVDDPVVDDLYELWTAARTAPLLPDPELDATARAWRLTLRALLDDPTALIY